MSDRSLSRTSPIFPTEPRPYTPEPWHLARSAAQAFAQGAEVSGVEVPLAAALGATLSEDLVSDIDVPSLDSAAMDGYAVAGRGPWALRGHALAGHRGPVDRLRAGEAVEVATGAVVPLGTDSVIPYEQAAVDGGGLRGEAEPGRHVRRRGETTPTGALVAPGGSPVTPALLGLAASLGRDTIPVVRPVVRALVTGDEVAQHGVPAPGTVRDAIGPVLPGLVAWAGGALEETTLIGDDRPAMLAALEGGRTADVIVVCGASSAGPADHLRGALDDAGAQVRIDGVACRPGHPQLLASLESGTFVVGLPGNPNAALVAALTLLVPLLSGITGRPDPAHTGRRVRLVGAPRARAHETTLVPVRVSRDLAAPVPHSGPADLRAAGVADGYAVVPPRRGWGRVELVELPG
ncbi:molybdopterin molybdotransferase MoeA [Nocardiopsis oceani]